MLAGIASGSVEGLHGVGLYLAAYAITTLGAFGVIAWMESVLKEGIEVDALAGLSKRQPTVAALLAIFMFSLTGIPPFGGFVGKYYVFMAAVRADLVWVAIIGVLTSAIGAYYYLRIVVLMYFKEGKEDTQPLPGPSVMAALLISALLIVLIGVYPATVLNLLSMVR
jgi:NADH-quinone oxidoreductase subunit N